MSTCPTCHGCFKPANSDCHPFCSESCRENGFEELQDEVDRLRHSIETLCGAMESMLPLVRLLKIRQVVQAGDDAINAVGLNPWCIAEGLASGDEPVSVSKFERAIQEARGFQ